VPNTESVEQLFELAERQNAGAWVSATLRLPTVAHPPDHCEGSEHRHVRAKIARRIQRPFRGNRFAVSVPPCGLDDHCSAIAAEGT
jgi:hypothetical protein